VDHAGGGRGGGPGGGGGGGGVIIMGSSSSSDGLRLRPTAPVLDEPREEEGPPGYWDYGGYNYGGCGYSDPYYVPWGGQFPQLRQGVLDPTDLPTVVPQRPPHPLPCAFRQLKK